MGNLILTGALERIGNMVWGWPLMGLFLGVGVLYMLRLRGLPVRRLGQALRYVFRDDGGGEGISSYAALCTALAATIGTGNIVGVATAVSAGGPGALFWMLTAAFFGMATQYAEGFLAVRFRRRSGDHWLGGPFCYIEYGLGRRWKWLAVCFAAIGVVVGLLGVGTVTQVNSITAAVENFFDTGREHVAFTLGGKSYTWSVVLSGALVAVVSTLVLLGGVKRITKVCETLVPLMSVTYLLFSALVLIRYASAIPGAVSLILRSAFTPRAVLGAGCGITVRTAMRMGIGRGVFTNEAGLGSSPIAAAEARGGDPVRQGLVTMTGTFIDTIVICTVTGLCLVVTGAWEAGGLEGVRVTDYAWRMALPLPESLSSFVLLVCLVFFAFATIIGWNFYGERCLEYLSGGSRRAARIYRALYLLAICVAPYFTVKAAWESADILNAVMALPNLLALLLLQGIVVKESKRTETIKDKKSIKRPGEKEIRYYVK